MDDESGVQLEGGGAADDAACACGEGERVSRAAGRGRARRAATRPGAAVGGTGRRGDGTVVLAGTAVRVWRVAASCAMICACCGVGAVLGGGGVSCGSAGGGGGGGGESSSRARCADGAAGVWGGEGCSTGSGGAVTASSLAGCCGAGTDGRYSTCCCGGGGGGGCSSSSSLSLLAWLFALAGGNGGRGVARCIYCSVTTLSCNCCVSLLFMMLTDGC